MEAVNPSTGRAMRGAKRARFLEEAARALNANGVTQTTMAEIAKRIGVSRAALYYYFEDQEDLVFQSYRRSCELMTRCLAAATRQGGAAIDVIDVFVDGMLSDEAAEFAALSEVAYLRPEQREIILGLYYAVLASLSEVLTSGARRGELRPCAVRIVGHAIIGMISWISMARRWRSSDPLTHRDMVEGIKNLLRLGIAVDRGAAVRYLPFTLSSSDVPVERVFDAATLAAAKQEALLASASWLFNLKGVDATSLEEIADRLGVTKKVIYHNVGDKETLVAECYRRAFRFYEGIAERTRLYEGPRIDAFCASAHALAESSIRDDIAPLAVLAGFETLAHWAKPEIQASTVRLMNSYLVLYTVGYAEGSIRALHARAFLAIYPGTFEWLPKWLHALNATERGGAAEEVATLVRIGLLPT